MKNPLRGQAHKNENQISFSTLRFADHVDPRCPQSSSHPGGAALTNDHPKETAPARGSTEAVLGGLCQGQPDMVLIVS
jgi:hypothetical protein